MMMVTLAVGWPTAWVRPKKIRERKNGGTISHTMKMSIFSVTDFSFQIFIFICIKGETIENEVASREASIHQMMDRG